MLHPSYSELISAVNSGVADGEEPVVNSRYSIVIATAKRARQLVAGEEPLVDADDKKKPLSVAVDELYNRRVKILSEEEIAELEASGVSFAAPDEAAAEKPVRGMFLEEESGDGGEKDGDGEYDDEYLDEYADDYEDDEAYADGDFSDEPEEDEEDRDDTEEEE